jgi:hypothetical protein
MANTILIKRSGTASAVPVAGDLTLGELSLNYTDGKLYFKNSGNVVTLLANANTVAATSLTNGTSNVIVASNANITVGVASTTVATFASTGLILPGIVSATGNITGGNITIPGSANISTFIGNTFFGSVPAQPTWYTIAPLNLNNSLAAATKVQLNLINTGGGAGAGSAIDFYTYQISVAAANAESRIAAIDDGNYSAYLSFQTKTPGSTGTNPLVERVKIDSTGASVVGNITGGNVLGGANVNATLHSGTTVSITGTVTSASVVGGVITGSSTSVTGNITGGNVLGGANVNATLHSGITVSVTGTITGASVVGGVITGSSTSVTGTQTAASTVGGVITGSSASVTGNVTGGNLITAGLASVTGNVNIGNATGVTWANAGGVRVWTYYNNATASLDTVFL